MWVVLAGLVLHLGTYLESVLAMGMTNGCTDVGPDADGGANALRCALAELSRLRARLTNVEADLERRVREQTRELAESERVYRSLVENSQDAFLVLDEHENLTRVMGNVFGLSGYTVAELQSMPVEQCAELLCHSQSRQALERSIAQARRWGSRSMVRFRLCDKAGEYRWCEGSVAPVYADGDGSLTGFQITVRDVGERVQAKGARAGAEARGIAHDLKDLLMSIHGHADAALRDLESAPQAVRGDLANILKGLGDAAEAVRGLCSLLSSSPGQGSTFAMRLPVAPRVAGQRGEESGDLPVSPQRAAPSPAAEQKQALRILVVDDDDAVRHLLYRFLEREGHYVTNVGNGRRALALLEQEAFDLLITDLGVPDVPGERIARRASETGLPVILCTGWGEAMTAEQLEEMGVATLLAKPFSRADLMAALEQIGI